MLTDPVNVSYLYSRHLTKNTIHFRCPSDLVDLVAKHFNVITTPDFFGGPIINLHSGRIIINSDKGTRYAY